MKRNEKIFFERSGKIGWIVTERACYRLQRQVGLHIIIIDEEKNLFGKSRLPVLLCEKVQAVIIEDFSKQQAQISLYETADKTKFSLHLREYVI